MLVLGLNLYPVSSATLGNRCSASVGVHGSLVPGTLSLARSLSPRGRPDRNATMYCTGTWLQAKRYTNSYVVLVKSSSTVQNTEPGNSSPTLYSSTQAYWILEYHTTVLVRDTEKDP